MTRTPDIPRAQRPRRWATSRTLSALLLREMSTTYGRSPMGYLWAILEPVGGIALLTIIFSFAFRSPELGTSFALFYATGMLPFSAYMDCSQKIAVSLRFNRPLLFYPGVTFLDSLLARMILSVFTQLMVSLIVLTGIIWIYDLDVIVDTNAIGGAYLMVFALAFGIGTLNCYLLSVYPVWERTWAILNRPLFIISCIFFLFDSIPQPFRDYLWWNPLVHLIGELRSGIYSTYDAAYVSKVYVYLVAGITGSAGLLLLRRYHKDIAND